MAPGPSCLTCRPTKGVWGISHDSHEHGETQVFETLIPEGQLAAGRVLVTRSPAQPGKASQAVRKSMVASALPSAAVTSSRPGLLGPPCAWGVGGALAELLRIDLFRHELAQGGWSCAVHGVVITITVLIGAVVADILCRTDDDVDEMPGIGVPCGICCVLQPSLNLALHMNLSLRPP